MQSTANPNRSTQEYDAKLLIIYGINTFYTIIQGRQYLGIANKRRARVQAQKVEINTSRKSFNVGR
jgi:hypothetical protein